MLSETLQNGLQAYEIGATIRTLRFDKGMGLEQLGSHTGLSAGMLSRIERGHIFPTLPTLLRIAMVFGVGLDYFFAANTETPALAIVRKQDRMRFPNTTEGRPQFHFESLDFPITDRLLETFLAEFSSATPTPPHSHLGAEVVYVLKGQLQINIQGDQHRLEEGDAMYFDPSPEHSYVRLGAENCTVFIAITQDSTSNE